MYPELTIANFFFLLTETELMKDGYVKQFSDSIASYGKYNGICLTISEYNLSHTLFVPNVPKDENNGNAAWRPEIILSSVDWKTILNNL